jgi:hypothetical protein
MCWKDEMADEDTDRGLGSHAEHEVYCKGIFDVVERMCLPSKETYKWHKWRQLTEHNPK